MTQIPPLALTQIPPLALTQIPPLALTMGDPAGIGTEITLKAWLNRSSTTTPFFTLSDADHITATAQSLGLPVPLQIIQSPQQAAGVFDKALPVLHRPLNTPAILGQPNTENAGQIIGSIEAAVDFTRQGLASAVVTNPIAKD
ncbi:MAG: 4-hydroxythreonine-4-phosphate dehydrogenase PdxA, partial [Magnetovibrio sp.]|nr:4-hydroxythreonine-4-phosphate dehydrogenase PdxA [Magnetovibrio sp.]